MNDVNICVFEMNIFTIGLTIEYYHCHSGLSYGWLYFLLFHMIILYLKGAICRMLPEF